MVAVPTVLGIASLRVYSVNEAPADGLVTREKVCIHDLYGILPFIAIITHQLSTSLSPAQHLHAGVAVCSG